MMESAKTTGIRSQEPGVTMRERFIVAKFVDSEY